MNNLFHCPDEPPPSLLRLLPSLYSTPVSLSWPELHPVRPPASTGFSHSFPRMCTHYVNNLFHLPDEPPPSTSFTPSPFSAHFTTYALHRTRLTSSITFATLYVLEAQDTALAVPLGHRCFTPTSRIALKIIQTECAMCSHLKWQLDAEPGALKEFEFIVGRDFKGPSPYPAHYTLPAPSSGPFAHPKPSTSNISTAIPSFGPGALPSPPSSNTPIPPEKSLRRSSADPYPTSTDVPQLPTPPASHLNVPFPANPMSPATPPNCKGDSAKIIYSGGSNTMQISGDSILPPNPHVHARKPSLLILAHATSIYRPHPSFTQPTLTYILDFLLSTRVTFLLLVQPLATVCLGYVVNYT